MFAPETPSHALIPLPDQDVCDIAFPTPQKGADDHDLDYDNAEGEDDELFHLQKHQKASRALANLANNDQRANDLDQLANKAINARLASIQLSKPHKLEQLSLEGKENIARIC